MNLSEHRDKYNQALGKKSYLQQKLSIVTKEIAEKQDYQLNLESAQALLQTVAQDTQNQLRFHIKDIVQMAIDVCWPGEIEFDILFEISRGKTEARLVFKNVLGDEVDPYEADGGGLVDISSLGLRIAAWTLGKTDNCIILDEPFKNLDNTLKSYGPEILKEVSEKLNLQFIIITHDDNIVDVADRIFRVKREKCEDGYYRSKIEVQ